MNSFLTLDDIDVTNKFVLVRTDLNLPKQEGKFTDLTRLDRLIPTLKELSEKRAKTIVISHFGRPDGVKNEKDSLRDLAPVLAKQSGLRVFFAEDCIGPEVKQQVNSLQSGEVILLENLRFHKEEEANDPKFAQALSQLASLYVNDAFSCSHRAHASIVGITAYLPSAAGRGMQAELEALEKAIHSPKHPVMAVVGGAKISTKLSVLENLMDKVDYLVVAGAMANTFLAAQGYAMGQSLYEPEMINTARDVLQSAQKKGCQIILPVDVVVAPEIAPGQKPETVLAQEVPPQTRIADAGKASVENLGQLLKKCHTVVWNGPLGVFEIPPFDSGTTAFAHLVATATKSGQLISVAGGGIRLLLSLTQVVRMTLPMFPRQEEPSLNGLRGKNYQEW